MKYPIQLPEQLPALGSKLDWHTWHLRSATRPYTPFDMAKDVAALANTQGGVLLVGAIEDEDEHSTLKRYEPMTQDATTQLYNAFSEAISERCIPQPKVSWHRVEVRGGFVIAGTVEKMASGLVGVAVESERNGPNKWRGYGWIFPLRSERGLPMLSPEELGPYFRDPVR